MKKTTVLLLTGVLFANLSGAPTPWLKTEPVSKRIINIGKKQEITLVKDGKVQFEVVRPSNPYARAAAAELTAFLSKITGQKISIVAKASGKIPAFYIGSGPEAKAAGLDPAKLDRDGFYIKTVGSKIFILGVDRNKDGIHERASVFAVQDFLERFAGVRYYFPGEIGTIIPKKKNWSIPAIDIADRPDFQYRWIWTSHSGRGGGNTTFNYPGKDPKTNNPNIWRNSALRDIRSCHGINALELVKRFGKTNPEFFALTAAGKRIDGTHHNAGYHKLGQLCFSSEGLKEVVYQDAVACLTGKPASSRGIKAWDSRWKKLHINITPNDGVIWCLCPPCKKIQEQGSQARSNHIWKFFVDIANRLKKNNIPGMVIVDSYGVYKDMPQMEIPDNISVGVCITGPWGMENKHVRERDAKRLAAWRKRLGRRLASWTYPTKASAAVPYIPNFTPRAVDQFFKSQKNNIFGGFVESGTDVWLFGFMNHYVAGKVMWDNSVDVEKIMEEHCRLMYGPAAPFMDKFYREIERLWMREILKDIIATTWGENWLLPTRRDIWTKIYSPAKIAELNKLFDQAEKAAAKNKEALKRVRFMRKNFWGPVIDGANEFSQENASRTAWTVHASPAQKITLDGKLNEKEWQNAESAHLIGRKWEPIQVSTTVKVLQDKDFFYFGFEAAEPFTDKIAASLKRAKDSGDIWRDSGIEVFLAADASSDYVYQYMVNALGATCDLRNTFKGGVSSKFNSGFEAKCSTVPGKKYVVEMRIPRKAMPELAGKNTIRVNFTRNRALTGMKVVPDLHAWYPMVRNIAEDFGILVLEKKETAKNLITAPDFDQPLLLKNRFMCVNGWAGNPSIQLDKKVFLTKGASVCLDKKHTSLIQTLPMKPDTKYSISFYVKTQNAKPGLRALVRFGSTKAGGVYVFGTYLSYIRGNTTWHRVERVFKTPKEFGKQYNPRLDLFVSNKEAGKCWIDHVELVEVK